MRRTVKGRRPLVAALEKESAQWCQQLAGIMIRTRRELGLTQQALAQQVGLTQRQISGLESDPDMVHLRRLYGTLRALGLVLVVQALD